MLTSLNDFIAGDLHEAEPRRSHRRKGSINI